MHYLLNVLNVESNTRHLAIIRATRVARGSKVSRILTDRQTRSGAICMKVKDKDIATSMEDYVTKYLLFDDVIKYERDIARYKTKQMTFIDIFCNPPKVA